MLEALIAKPDRNRKRARAVMAEDHDRSVFVELLEGARGDFIHRDEGRAFDARGFELPGLTDFEQEWWRG